MAESQVPYPNEPLQVQSIRSSLSEPRFGAYLTKGGGDVGYALALYLYNARLAKAFLFPLHVVEVTLRNAMDAMLVARHGLLWHEDAGFRAVLHPKGATTLDRALGRWGVGASRSQVVAELTFDFWSNLLRAEYGDLWRTTLTTVFPNLVRPMNRHDVQSMARAVNRLRNRVAHHEPILDANVPEILSTIFDLLGLRCGETAQWTRHHTTVGAVLRTRPRAADGAGTVLSGRLASGFVSVTADVPLSDVLAALDRDRQAVVVVDEVGAPIAAFSALDLTRYVGLDAARHDGLFAASERLVADVLAEPGLGERFRLMPHDRPLLQAVDVLRGVGVDVLVGVDPASGAPSGIMMRAHRRY